MSERKRKERKEHDSIDKVEINIVYLINFPQLESSNFVIDIYIVLTSGISVF